MKAAGKSVSLEERAARDGFAIVREVVSEDDIADLKAMLGQSELPRSRAGMRHAMRNASVAALLD